MLGKVFCMYEQQAGLTEAKGSFEEVKKQIMLLK
jgi:hypothetical protein